MKEEQQPTTKGNIGNSTQKAEVRPVKVFRIGAIAASVWERQAPSGFRYHDFSLSRSWKTQKTGREGYSSNFFGDNQAAICNVVAQACSWIETNKSDKEKESRGNSNGREQRAA